MSRSAVRLFVIAFVFSAAGCDKVPLLAPTGSTVTLSVSTAAVGSNGSAEVVASVIEAGGTPVHDGTEVTFQSSVGTLDPPTARTARGIARTTFRANGASGTAQIVAFSGGARSDSVDLLVGGAAVESLTIRAEPNSLTVSGGSVQVIATAVDASGNPLGGAPVVFSATSGTLNPVQASTDATGEARTTLTTTRESRVTATVAGKTAETTVTILAQPTINLTAAPNPPAVGMPVTFNIAPSSTNASPRTPLRSLTFDPGDGSGPRNLGVNATSFTHIYRRADSFTARAVAIDVADQTSESTIVLQAIRVLPTVTIALPSAGVVANTPAQFTINSAPGTSPIAGPPIEVVRVTFSDGESYEVGPGQRTIERRFTTPGSSYTVTATVHDTAGTSVQTQVPFVVRAGGFGNVP